MPTVRPLIAAALLSATVVPTAHAQAPSRAWEAMCTAQETPIRGCVMRSGKYLAFCIPKGQDFRPVDDPDAPGAPPAVSYMQYRYGQPGDPELVFPKRLRGSAARFRVAWYLAARGATTRITFRRGSYTYRYVNLFLARGQGEPHAVTHGIEVWRGGRRLSFLRCADDNN